MRKFDLARAVTGFVLLIGATVALARTGVLNRRRHTSNFRDFLVDNAREYSGAEHYVEELSVRDRAVITASGLGSVEFARDILAEAGVYSETTLASWYDAFKHGRYAAPAE